LNRYLYGGVLHFWIVLDVYDNKGRVTGQEALSYDPGYDKDNLLREFKITSPREQNFPRLPLYSVTSNQCEDQALHDLWKSLGTYAGENRKSPAFLGKLNFTFFTRNCLAASRAFLYYGIKEKTTTPIIGYSPVNINSVPATVYSIIP